MPRIFMTGRQRALLAQCWYGQSDPLYAVVSRCVADAGGEFAMGSVDASHYEAAAILNCAGEEWSDEDSLILTPLFVAIDVELNASPDDARFDPMCFAEDYAPWEEFGGVEGVRQ